MLVQRTLKGLPGVSFLLDGIGLPAVDVVDVVFLVLDEQIGLVLGSVVVEGGSASAADRTQWRLLAAICTLGS